VLAAQGSWSPRPPRSDLRPMAEDDAAEADVSEPAELLMTPIAVRELGCTHRSYGQRLCRRSGNIAEGEPRLDETCTGWWGGSPLAS